MYHIVMYLHTLLHDYLLPPSFSAWYGTRYFSLGLNWPIRMPHLAPNRKWKFYISVYYKPYVVVSELVHNSGWRLMETSPCSITLLILDWSTSCCCVAALAFVLSVWRAWRKVAGCKQLGGSELQWLLLLIRYHFLPISHFLDKFCFFDMACCTRHVRGKGERELCWVALEHRSLGEWWGMSPSNLFFLYVSEADSESKNLWFYIMFLT